MTRADSSHHLAMGLVAFMAHRPRLVAALLLHYCWLQRKCTSQVRHTNLVDLLLAVDDLLLYSSCTHVSSSLEDG